MPQLFTNVNKKSDKMQGEYEEQIEILYAEVGRSNHAFVVAYKKIWS